MEWRRHRQQRQLFVSLASDRLQNKKLGEENGEKVYFSLHRGINTEWGREKKNQ